MGLYSDSSEIEAITGEVKRQIFVGICGSFSENTRPILEGLKKYLNENGYSHVCTADDFPTERPRITTGDEKYKDAYDTSIQLVNECDIIIIFFFDSKRDTEINQSAIAEIQELCSKKKRNVIVLSEEGFKFKANLKGIKIKSTEHKWWEWNNFLMYQMEDCYFFVKQSCQNIILERLVRRDI